MATSKSGEPKSHNGQTGAPRSLLWVARACIGVVLFANVQCALAFIVTPASYAAGFQLSGLPGAIMARSLGLLFLMWNVPYAVATWHPLRYRTSLMEAIAMQAIGLSGELLMLWNLPQSGYEALRATGQRFVRFDAGGLALLVIALACVALARHARAQRQGQGAPEQVYVSSRK